MNSNRYVAGRSVVLAAVKLLFLALTQLPLISAAPFAATGHGIREEDDGKPADDPSLWLYLGIAFALVVSGGIFAGLTIALMGQDEIYLQVIQTSGDDAEKKNATTVLNLLNRGKHWILVTLLLSNVITNETLPIILDRSLGGGWPAVIGSTVLIVIFGEVVPQSICVRYGLPIGAWMAPWVLALMYISAPIAWPIAKLLDRLLGEDHGNFYKKAGLKTLVTLHKNFGAAGEQLNSDEVTIISAVLDLKEKPVGSIMIPMEDVFTMSVDSVLDEKTMDVILSQGYSRIPIYSRENSHNFVGMLLVKMLITYDPEDCKLVRDFALATLPETRPETSCLDIVNFFQEGKSHMVLVSEYPGEDHGALGVVTLEDVIEELIGEEIIDESDVFIDVHKAIRRMAPAPKSRVPKGRIVAEPPDVPTTAELIHLDDAASDRRSSISRSWQGDHHDEPPRKGSVPIGSPPQPTFYLRKASTFDSANGSDTSIIKRGPTPEIREHLKHLGPSNLASRPRQTRYSNVKIKRGGSSPGTPNHVSDAVGSDVPSLISPPAASETASLLGSLKSSATPKAPSPSNAAYGTLLRSTLSTPSTNVHPETIPEDASKASSTHDADTALSEHDENGRSSPGQEQRSRVVIKSPEAKKRNRPLSTSYRLHGPTRSGSITEQIVDSNGIRKVVLQTGSTSPSEDDSKASTATSQAKTNKTSALLSPTSTDEPASREVSSASGNKKKRRRKRKQGGSKTAGGTQGDEESRPLLDE
ncbi:hypothetical protein AJ80_04131 [Polytolypa hystricis UAMH7299]|uniref:CNNM transmembrane domain-containing protein n=1 Tax=Polytolypa hystricis (strain UAMH7299) TaxID=1447883 RepID=A0A2B7YDB9_POLH7|nr:hypothetical protein AJ80_04131 [Polytolypa hystricis UAMH7299]